jgi:hypothetical protein
MDMADGNIARAVHFIDAHDNSLDEGDLLCWNRSQDDVVRES